MKRRDITNLLQRLEAFEERLNVCFEAISAFECKEEYSDDHEIVVSGELHTTNGTSLSTDIEIQLSVYDKEGRVIETDSTHVDAEKFFGFETFQLKISVHPKTVAKLRLLPKLS